MEKTIKSWFNLMIVVILLPIIISGCTNQFEGKDNIDHKWDYRPMITKENFVYGDTGKVDNTMPQESILLGVIESRVSQTEPMVKGKPYFVSNSLPMETKVYGNEQSEEIIYVDYNDCFVKYELIEK